MAETTTLRGTPRWPWAATAWTSLAALGLLAGCPSPPSNPPIYNNTTDPTNGGAHYVGASACGSCHSGLKRTVDVHGHSQALSKIEGIAPVYPEQGIRAGVPNPPPGFSWQNISYVIAGYIHGAFFVDSDGFILTSGTAGVDTQWDLDFPPNGTSAGFVAYLPGQQEPLPYDYATCFRCHTTGPRPQDPQDPQSQDNRPGILGTWAEAGVKCEACHGPGSNHVPDPQARDLFVDSTSQTCARCHLAGDDPNVILASDGYVNSNTQTAELLASGGHSDFACGYCHSPHASTVYDRSRGLRNTCRSCHPTQNMGRHAGIVFERGTYREELSCESCHMPFAGRSASTASPEIVGSIGRMGDVRSHIFRVSTRDADYTEMFTAGGTRVVKDAQGRASVTVDFVCLRCHTEASAAANNAVPLTVSQASALAGILHNEPQ